MPPSPIPKYTGPCPKTVAVTGTITTDGPGTVWYRCNVGSNPEEKQVTFTAAGTKTVTGVLTYSFGAGGGTGNFQAVMEEAPGKRAPDEIYSEPVEYAPKCTTSKGAGPR